MVVHKARPSTQNCKLLYKITTFVAGRRVKLHDWKRFSCRAVRKTGPLKCFWDVCVSIHSILCKPIALPQRELSHNRQSHLKDFSSKAPWMNYFPLGVYGSWTMMLRCFPVKCPLLWSLCSSERGKSSEQRERRACFIMFLRMESGDYNAKWIWQCQSYKFCSSLYEPEKRMQRNLSIATGCHCASANLSHPEQWGKGW